MSENGTASVAPMRELIAEEIRALLGRRKVGVSELARRIGVTQPYLSRRLNGDVAIDVDDLALIAHELGVEMGDLLPRPTEGRVLKTVPRLAEPQGAGTKDIQAAPAGRPRLTGQGPGDHTHPSLVRTARKRPALTHNAPSRPMRGR